MSYYLLIYIDLIELYSLDLYRPDDVIMLLGLQKIGSFFLEYPNDTDIIENSIMCNSEAPLLRILAEMKAYSPRNKTCRL